MDTKLIAVFFMFVLIPVVNAAVGPSCSYEKIIENSNFVIQGEVTSSEIIENWSQGDADYHTNFALVQIKIKVLNVVKGDKKINDEIDFDYETILEDTGGWAGGIYYKKYEVGDLVEYRAVEEVLGTEENPCVAEAIFGIDSITPKAEPETNSLLYYLVGAILLIALILVLIKLKK